MNSIHCKDFQNGNIISSSTGCFRYYLVPSLLPFSHIACPTVIMNTFLCYLVARTLVFKPYLTSGAFICEMTADLGCLDPHAMRSLKKVFKVLLQSSFWHRFLFGCPVRSLSFLPRAMGCEGGWRQIRVSVLCQALGLTMQDLNAFCESSVYLCT